MQIQELRSNKLHLVSFSNFYNWSVQYLLEINHSYNEEYNLVRIGDFLKRNKTSIEVKDTEEYKRVTIKINNGGIFLRDIEKGFNIGTKNQFIISEGQFLVSKIDARNGAFGVVPKEVDKSIITGNFWTFDVDYNQINPHFLALITTTPEFIRFSQNASNGTTNRHYLQEKLFLEQKIPLPTLEEQNKIVVAYQEKIKLAEQQARQAKQLETEIENYLMEELGIQSQEIKPFIKGHLNLFHFSEMNDRWDFHKGDSSVFSMLKHSKYTVKQLSEVFNFINRGWNKSTHKEDYFNYIEMSGVDSMLGIFEASNVQLSKAPSRATQIIKTNDLIIGTTRPYLKKFAIVSEEYNYNVASSAFQIIEPDEKYCLEFLLEFLKSSIGVKQFEFYMTGALYPAITSKDLRRILIPVPPVEKQKEISIHINSLKNQIRELNELSRKNKEEAIKEFERMIFKS